MGHWCSEIKNETKHHIFKLLKLYLLCSFPHLLHLSSRHHFRPYITYLCLFAVGYDLAVSSNSLLFRCSYYNSSVHELQVFECNYKALKGTCPSLPPCLPAIDDRDTHHDPIHELPTMSGGLDSQSQTSKPSCVIRSRQK